MAKNLSDSSLTILAAAAAREDLRVLPLPKLKAPPVIVRKTIASLLTSGLVAAVPAKPDDEVWATDATEGRQTLIVTSEGLAAIGIEPHSAGDTAPPQPQAARTAETASPPPQTDSGPTKPRSRPRGRVQKLEPKPTERRPSKQDIVLGLLRRQQGASVAEMMGSTGWQPHSVRGFMSGALKRRLGIEVISEVGEDGERRYFVAPLRGSGDRG